MSPELKTPPALRRLPVAEWKLCLRDRYLKRNYLNYLSVYVHVPEAPSPRKRAISVTSFFPSLFPSPGPLGELRGERLQGDFGRSVAPE